nr:RNA-directed DNA polymerase, eukaryota [Tanacetum cinerariifolium]
DDVLNSFGFGSKWRSWIRGSLCSGKASILVNGSPTVEFQFHRGLKQRDPLALFLFIIVMESLHLSFSRAVEAGIFTGIKIDSSLTLSHLFYADDAMFIGEWSNGGNMSLVKEWDESIAKLKKKLSKWKLKTLSVWGRLTLLKAVLGSTPIYNMSLLRFPNRCLIQWNEYMAFFTSYSLIWSTIIKEVNSLKAQGVDLLSHCSFRRVVRGGAESHQLSLLTNLL